jgi:8-oxo-dGTP pyrophosphatase MutT (NUDIX family)
LWNAGVVENRRAFSVAVFCRNGGEILLVRHKRLDLWLPVGGEIEAGETPLEAARRELREETGPRRGDPVPVECPLNVRQLVRFALGPASSPLIARAEARQFVFVLASRR